MNKRDRKTGRIISYVLIVGLVSSLIYNIYDNRRFTLVEQEIVLERLPQAFDGFRILQISDLHGSYFGDHQADLVNAINRLDYDMIALTGDMNASTAGDESVENSQAVLDLLEGIDNRAEIYWIDGNSGPHAVETVNGAMTGSLKAIGKVLQEKGCKILTMPHAITRGSDRIWITPEMSESGFQAQRWFLENGNWPGGKENVAAVQAFYEQTYATFQSINGNPEVKILLTHAPKQVNLSVEEVSLIGDLDYDLILAGHYHGGQLRLPLIGALYIPSPTTGINNSGLFPAQNAVKGLSYYGDIPQYVSAGLGASGHIRFASFRLFNTPEINRITLKRRSSE